MTNTNKTNAILIVWILIVFAAIVLLTSCSTNKVGCRDNMYSKIKIVRVSSYNKCRGL